MTATVTAATAACNGSALLVGLADGLFISLVAQSKPAPSTKADIQPSYIATQHARRVTGIAATANVFATASDDCTIVVSQIGCLFGGEGAAHNGTKGSKLRYRITGAHALPILSLVFLPSDENLLASASLDGSVVIHRLRFTKAAASASATLPTVPLAQSVDRLIRLPFAVHKLLPLSPSDGTLLAAAGWDAEGQATVAIIDLSVAHRDGDGSGRPLKPFSLLVTESPIISSSNDIRNQSDTLQLLCDGTHLTLVASRPTHAPFVACCQAPPTLAYVTTSAGDSEETFKSATWSISNVLKGIANCRVAEDAKGVVTDISLSELEANINQSTSRSTPHFIGSQGQVGNAIAAIVGPNAKPNDYYATLYANFCWSSSARPAACVGTVVLPSTKITANSDSSDDEGADDEGCSSGTGTSQGLGKRARKTKSRQHRAEADAADWARLALAMDGSKQSELALPSLDNEMEPVPFRYTQLLTARSLAAHDSPYEYEPLVASLSLKAVQSRAPSQFADESDILANLESQRIKNAAIQARIDVLYAALSEATAATNSNTRKSGRDVSGSPNNERPSKRHTTEKGASKKSISLT